MSLPESQQRQSRRLEADPGSHPETSVADLTAERRDTLVWGADKTGME